MLREFNLKLYTFDNASDRAKVWSCIQNDCPSLTEWGIGILEEGLGRNLRAIVLEPNYICKDHRSLHSHYYSKKFTVSSPITARLHFFSKILKGPEEVLLVNFDQSLQENYLGYSVIRPVPSRCLGRTVVNPYKANPGLNHFYCLTTSFRANINGAAYKVTGFPYMAQDTDVTVCAHSALWSVCRYLSERYKIYKEVYPFDIVKMTGNTNGRTFPYRGMTYEDYSSILSSFGVYPVIFKNRDYNDLRALYTYVESGFPVLVSFYEHVITLIGHTVDYDKHVDPDEDGFIDSYKFLKQYVVCDDNAFPYRLLGVAADPDSYTKKLIRSGTDPKPIDWSIESIKVAICPLPEKVFLPEEKVRNIIMDYFTEVVYKIEQYIQKPWVTRLFVTTSTSFKRSKLQHLQRSGSPDRIAASILNIDMPHFIWVMELSSVDQYKAGECTSELVYDTTAGNKEDGFVYMRIGNEFLSPKGDKKRSFSEIKIPESPASFSQYTHNLERRTPA